MRKDLSKANSFIFRGCVTPLQIQNLNKAIENNLDYLDGYAELDPTLQMVVEKALKEGHVDDSDWCGVSLDRLIYSTRMLTFGRIWNKIVQGSRGFVKQLQRRNSPWSQLRYMNHPCIHDLEAVSWIKFRSPCQADADGSRTASRPAQIKRGRDKTNEYANNGHADGRPIIELKTGSKRSKDYLEKATDTVEPPTKKLQSSPKKTKKAQAGDAESEPKSDKDPPKKKKADSEKIGPIIGHKEVNREHVTASPPRLSSRRPRRERAAVSKIGPEANETNVESNASKSDDFERERKVQRRRKKAGGNVRK